MSVSTAWPDNRLLVRYLSTYVPTGVHAAALKAAPDSWQITHHPWWQELLLLVGKAPSHCLRKEIINYFKIKAKDIILA